MRKVSDILLIIFSAIIGLAALLCLFINFIISKEITWSAITTVSCAILWLLQFIILKIKKHKMLAIFALISISTIPLLFVIDYFTINMGWWLTMGVPITLASVVYLWIIYLLVFTRKIRIWYSLALIAALEPVFKYVILYIVLDKFTRIISVDMIIDIIAAIGCFVAFVLVGIFTGRNHQKKINEIDNL